MRAAFLLLAAAELVTPVSLIAQPNEQAVVDEAIERACTGRAGQSIPRGRLAKAMIVAARQDDLDGEGQSAIDAVTFAEDRSNLLRGARALIQEQLATPGSTQAKALQVAPPPPPRTVANPREWLFGENGFTLTCAAAAPPEAPPTSFPKVQTIIVRRNVDEMFKTGDDRLTAESAQIGWERSRVTSLSGEVKRSRSLNIDAAVGLAFGTVDAFVMPYADYSQSRVRISTEPEPTAKDDDGRADDVEALELGMFGTARPAEWLRTTGRAGVTFDEISKARTLHGVLTLVPITGGRPSLGLCNLNSFRPTLLGLEGRCFVAAEADLRHVLRKGAAEFTDADELLGLGGRVGIEFRKALDVSGRPQDGFVAGATYRYLNLLSGRGPDIDRFEVTLAYRWWARDLGFDLGFTYADGTEFKSLADEHKFGITFGIVY